MLPDERSTDRRSFLRTTAGAAIAAAALAACRSAGGGSTATGTLAAAPVDGGDRDVNRDARSLHRSTLVVNGLDPSNLRAEYLDMLTAGGVHCWHRGGGNTAAFSTMLAFCDRHADRITSVGTVREIREARQAGKIAHISGWQSADVLVGDGSPDRPAISSLRGYRELGLRICSIAYNVPNAFGGGCLAPEMPLTAAGRQLVEQVHALRIVLDVAGHTGEQTSLDALAMSSGVPVVCTHTNVRALTDNPRCTTDRVFEAIARTGGVIGLTAFNDFHARSRRDAGVPITPQVALEKHLDQYDYLKRLVGVEHIGLGPDFVNGPGRNDPGTVDRSRMPAEVYSEKPWLYVKGFEDISELPNVTQGLIGRGWTTAELRKMLGENWLRVYDRVWGS